MGDGWGDVIDGLVLVEGGVFGVGKGLSGVWF